MAGYSETPLTKKLGLKAGQLAHFINPPRGYLKSLGPLPAGTRVVAKPIDRLDFIQFFSKEIGELERRLPELMKRIAPNGMIWVSWPKKASGVSTTITEILVRKTALPLGLVDVKVCAVDQVWSGLKLVIRIEHRATAEADRQA